MPALRDVEIGQWFSIGQAPRVGWGGNVINRETYNAMCCDRFGDLSELSEIDENIPQYHEPSFTDTLAYHLTSFLSALSVTQQPIERLPVGVHSDNICSRRIYVSELQTLLLSGAYCRGVRIALSSL